MVAAPARSTQSSSLDDAHSHKTGFAWSFLNQHFTMTSRQPRHVLRSLLRLVKTPPLPKELLQKNATTQSHHINNIRSLVVQEFRSRSALDSDTANSAAKKMTLLSSRYLELLENLEKRQQLYDLDRGAEEQFTPKELSRRAAARAGLQLPEDNSSGAPY